MVVAQILSCLGANYNILPQLRKDFPEEYKKLFTHGCRVLTRYVTPIISHLRSCRLDAILATEHE